MGIQHYHIKQLHITNHLRIQQLHIQLLHPKQSCIQKLYNQQVHTTKLKSAQRTNCIYNNPQKQGLHYRQQ